MKSILRLVTVAPSEHTASFFPQAIRIAGGWVMKNEPWHALSEAAQLIDAGEGRLLVAMPSMMSASSERRVDDFEILRLLDGDIARLHQQAPKWAAVAEKWRKEIARVAEPQAQVG
jgi:predicted metal-dependent HD superfamily phosphohydrolase